jgi:hypothetical protein
VNIEFSEKDLPFSQEKITKAKFFYQLFFPQILYLLGAFVFLQLVDV